MTDSTSGDAAITDDAVEVIRHAERLRASTITRPLARAVLRKRIVTETRTITVQVRHEEADLELLPPDPAADAVPRGAHAALPEVVLWEERIELVSRLVPIERVRLEIDQITTTRTLSGTVAQEVVDLDQSE